MDWPEASNRSRVTELDSRPSCLSDQEKTSEIDDYKIKHKTRIALFDIVPQSIFIYIWLEFFQLTNVDDFYKKNKVATFKQLAYTLNKSWPDLLSAKFLIKAPSDSVYVRISMVTFHQFAN